MNIRKFAETKTRGLEEYLSSWLQEFEFKSGQSLIIQGRMSGSGCAITIEGVDRKSRSKAIDRPLTEEELRAIDNIDSFSPAQREFVELFLGSGNKPVIRRDLMGWSSTYEQVNRVIKREGLDISFCAFYPQNRRPVPHWEQELCFRPVSRT